MEERFHNEGVTGSEDMTFGRHGESTGLQGCATRIQEHGARSLELSRPMATGVRGAEVGAGTHEKQKHPRRVRALGYEGCGRGGQRAQEFTCAL